MRSVNAFVAILTAKILFLEVGKWTIGEVSGLNIALSDANINSPDFPLVRPSCSEVITRKVEQFVPYTETYKTKIWGIFYQVKTRINYMIQYRTVEKVKSKCCEGYRKYDEFCKPICLQTCVKGSCVAPNVCTCNTGYWLSNDTNGKQSCTPVCTNDCVNGTCVDPEICSCNDGYWMDSDGFTCRPVCNDECERNRGFCSEPNVCSCLAGYRKADDDTSFKCEPICDRECTNGYCVAPNLCKCADGYEIDEFDSRFTCKPKCREACIFGTCTAPEICTCNDGYKGINTSVCEPNCSESCRMGTCVAPETCSCNDGYGLLAGSTYICEPICEVSCGNGTCTAPGVCICEEGYVFEKHENRMCKPHCKLPCGRNGRCASPDNCTCFEGYGIILPNDSSSDQAFVNSTEESYSVCQPICDFDCINGECTAPNECTCAKGYLPSWNETHRQLLSFDNITAHICKAYCTIPCGSNEICTVPDNCTCKNGYEKNTNDRCVPVCDEVCYNGTCIEPNRCMCNDGFAPRNESVCEPVCENACQNGDCIGPNQCICHDNFVLNIGHYLTTECIPTCTRNCSGHGVCVIANKYKCKCNLGWTEPDCDGPTMCVIIMDINHRDINEITVRNDTNSTMMQIYETAPHCQQCDNYLSNNSLCYMVHSDKVNTTAIVACFLGTDLPCYINPYYNGTSNIDKIAWSWVIIGILIATGLTAIAYLIYRRYTRNKLHTHNARHILAREPFISESLLSENAIYL